MTRPDSKSIFFPNLLTAGNLFCGFLALTTIVQADISQPDKFNTDIREALSSSCSRVFSICLMDGSRGWGDTKVRLAVNLIPWLTSSPSE